MYQSYNVDSPPLLSIIIPVYNAEMWIANAIQSIVKQNFSSLQILIIDGQSKDNTLRIINQYSTHIDTVVSEQDHGIYDAMNKGISRSIGKWIYFLGADDQLEPDILHKIAPYLAQECAVVYGSVRFDTGQQLISAFNKRMLLQNMVHHQGAFYHRSLFESFRYDINLRIISDYELNLRVYLMNLPTCKLPFSVAICHAGGASSNMPLSLAETNIVRSRYIKSWRGYVLTNLLKAYYWQKRLRRPNQQS